MLKAVNKLSVEWIKKDYFKLITFSNKFYIALIRTGKFNVLDFSFRMFSAFLKEIMFHLGMG